MVQSFEWLPAEYVSRPTSDKSPADRYEAAKDAIEGTRQWTSDLVLYDNGAGRVYVSKHNHTFILN